MCSKSRKIKKPNTATITRPFDLGVGQRKRLIILDWNEDFGVVLRDRLEEIGYAIVIATNPFEALRILSLIPLDGILLNLHMPDVDGLKILEQIHQSYPHIPIIVLSAELEHEKLAKAIQHGATEYLTMPIDPQLLANKCKLVFE